MQQAVEFAPTNPKVYVRRASVRKMIGDDNGAVDDLILALSLQSDDKDAVAALVEYGNTNYAATITALTNAMQLAPDNALYRYLRAMIAEAHYNYRAAADDFSYILDNKLYNYHGINASLARCLYGLGRYDEALAQIDNALGQVDNVAEYYVLRSRILRALGRGDDAINSAAKALAVDRTSVAALQEMAMNYVDKKSYRQASDLLAEASMDDVNNPEVYLLRAWLQGSKQGNASNAQTLNSRALDVEGLHGCRCTLRCADLLCSISAANPRPTCGWKTSPTMWPTTTDSSTTTPPATTHCAAIPPRLWSVHQSRWKRATATSTTGCTTTTAR